MIVFYPIFFFKFVWWPYLEMTKGLYTSILKRKLFRKYFEVCIPQAVDFCRVSSNSRLYSKRFNINNTFTFKKEFQQKFDNDSSIDGRIVSSDLLSEKNKFPREKKKVILKRETNRPKLSNKPSLTYRGEILFGIHPVYLALLEKKRILYHLYMRKEADCSEESISRREEIFKLADSMNIPVSFVDSRGLKILAPNTVHQGVCLDAGFLPLSTWVEKENECQTYERIPLWLVLDEILDPMNVGAVIRSSYYFGVDKLFTVQGNSCKLSPTVSKASSGALEVMDICQIANLEDFIRNRKDNGWCIASTLAYCENESKYDKPPIDITDFSLTKPTVLILGNEGRGISENIKNLCHLLISIEPGQSLHQGIDSLNVSVAAGVLLYALNSKMRR